MKRLRERKIVLGNRLLITLEDQAWAVVVFKVGLKNHSRKTREELFKFLKGIWNVSFMAEYMGSFDLSISCRFTQLGDAAHFSQSLRNRFSTELSRIAVIPLLRSRRVDNYPFRKWPGN